MRTWGTSSDTFVSTFQQGLSKPTSCEQIIMPFNINIIDYDPALEDYPSATYSPRTGSSKNDSSGAISQEEDDWWGGFADNPDPVPQTADTSAERPTAMSDSSSPPKAAPMTPNTVHPHNASWEEQMSKVNEKSVDSLKCVVGQESSADDSRDQLEAKTSVPKDLLLRDLAKDSRLLAKASFQRIANMSISRALSLKSMAGCYPLNTSPPRQFYSADFIADC